MTRYHHSCCCRYTKDILSWEINYPWCYWTVMDRGTELHCFSSVINTPPFYLHSSISWKHTKKFNSKSWKKNIFYSTISRIFK